jgi:hypothetical protein
MIKEINNYEIQTAQQKASQKHDNVFLSGIPSWKIFT